MVPSPSPFEEFFADAFQRQLEAVRIPADAWATPPAEPGGESWDRKAAWLVWCHQNGMEPDMAPPPAAQEWPDY